MIVSNRGMGCSGCGLGDTAPDISSSDMMFMLTAVATFVVLAVPHLLTFKK